MANACRRQFNTSIHIMALDGIVNVNSLFTFAVFLGIAWYPTTDPANSLVIADADPACVADAAIGESLIAFHVYSFSSFLFSSLLASALKQAIRMGQGGGAEGRGYPMASHVNAATLRAGILVSAAGSVLGCVFLMLALVDLVQIKLGTLACRSWHSMAAVGPLVVLVPFALVVFVSLVLYAFAR